MSGAGRINWLLKGEALQTRRRRAGADAQRGYDFQRAYAVLKIAEMLRPKSDIVGVRYEGAQDVDLALRDGSVEFVQIKNEADETYGAGALAAILVGFALDLHDTASDSRVRFALVVRSNPGSAALVRLEKGTSSEQDRATFLSTLMGEPRLEKLGVTKVAGLLTEVLSRLRVDKGNGWLGDTPAFALAAERELREAGVAPELLLGLLAKIERELKGRPEIWPDEIGGWARAARRLPDRAFMSPSVPRHYTPRATQTSAMITKLDECGVVALVGLPGSGKTTLAQALSADEFVNAKYPDGVLWAALGQKPDLAAHCQSMLRVLGQPPGGGQDEAALLAELRGALKGRSMLVVLDDVWTDGLIERLGLPSNCGLVVTTRQPRLARAADPDPVEVGGMDLPEAVALIEAFSGREVLGDLRADAERFARRVSGLPLAIRLGTRLFVEGRSFDRLIVDLDHEEKRLSSLDVDVDDAAAEGDRRTLSVEACIGISVIALSERLRRAFYSLAILPENEALDPQLAAGVFDVDVEEALGLLGALASRGLLTSSSPAYLGTYRVHDLVLDYARSGFGPRRAAVVAVPPDLPVGLSELHWLFIERARRATPSGRWSDIGPDFYFSEHLDWHLGQAGRPNVYVQVLRESDGGRATWLARQRRLQRTGAFFRLVELCIGHARAMLHAPGLTAEGAAAALMDALTAATAGAAATEQIHRTPVGMLAPSVSCGDMPFDEALGHAIRCDYALRAFHLVDLLPLAGLEHRRGMLRAIEEQLFADILPAVTDEDLLDRLLPLLNAAEIATLEARSRSVPANHAALLAGRFRAAWPTNSQAVQEIVEVCRRSDEPELRGNLVLFAASGAAVEMDAQLLLDSAKASKSKAVKAAMLALMPAEVLETFLGTPGVAELVFDAWGKFPQSWSASSAAAIGQMISKRRRTDPSRAAWLRARLLAVTPSVAVSVGALAECEAELRALLDTDWQKFDGLGWLMAATPPRQRVRLVEALADAGSSSGFAVVGAMRLRAIASVLPHEGFEAMAAAVQSARPAVRAMVFASLLANAPEALRPSMSMFVLGELSLSGEIGDMLGVADILPVEMLTAIRVAKNCAPLSPDLVCAVEALSGGVPARLLAEFERTWSSLAPHVRVRAAAAHANVAALYDGPRAMLDDVLQVLGMTKDAPCSPIGIEDEAYILAAMPRIADDDIRAMLEERPELIKGIEGFGLASFVKAFGRALSSSERRDLIERACRMPASDRAKPLGFLARGTEAAAARQLAIDAILEVGSRAGAALWIIETAPVLQKAEAARLCPLRSPDHWTDDAVMLEVALYPSLDEDEQASVEARCRPWMTLFPGFIERLDRTLYSERMCQWFNLRLGQVAIRRLQGDAKGANCINDARILRNVEPSVLARIVSVAPEDPEFAATCATEIAATGYRAGMDGLFAAIARVAPLVRRSFEKGALEPVVDELALDALTHLRS